MATINQMIDEMNQTLDKISRIGTRIKLKDRQKYDDLFVPTLKHSQEWAFYLRKRVISNYKKVDIEKWYKQSHVSLKHAQRREKEILGNNIKLD